MPHISVVSPVYQAEACVAELCRRLRAAIAPLTESFEIILIEDRSPDNSWAAIQAEAAKDSRVRGLRLARNSGQHRAITAGLDVAKGDWVVVMDCDLQDPPEEIPRLYDKAMDGYEIVVAQFEERTESAFRQKTSRIFWRGLSWLAGMPFDHRIGNFRIMSQSVVENFRLYREQLRLLGGITTLMGFTTASLPVRRDERFAGETSYTLGKLLSIAIEIAMAYSDKPLKLSVMAGLFISGLSIIVGGVILVLGLGGFVEVPGWASVMVSLYLLGGLVIANLGVVGYYVGKTFDETKRRPLYIVERTTYEHTETNKKSGLVAAKSQEGRVVWITGPSCADKSTLALELATILRSSGKTVVILDSYERNEMSSVTMINAGNSGQENQLALTMQYAHLSRLIANQGVTVVAATISLPPEIHAWNREHLPGYFEAYLKVPIWNLRRDGSKGSRHHFGADDLENTPGLDLPIDEPEAPDWIADLKSAPPISVLAARLLAALENRKNP